MKKKGTFPPWISRDSKINYPLSFARNVCGLSFSEDVMSFRELDSRKPRVAEKFLPG